MSNLDRYRADLTALTALADKMMADLLERNRSRRAQASSRASGQHHQAGVFEDEYQNWYSEAAAVVRQLTPDRLDEFVGLYMEDGRRKAITAENYSIQDWLRGIHPGPNRNTGEMSWDDLAAVAMRLRTQAQILKAAERRFESSLFDIRQMVQADIFDSELESASELLKHKFLRAAGAVAGVVLEKHLAQVCANHNCVVRKKNPTIGDFNELLKENAVVDVPEWRRIQRLADIRNLCDHNREREPKDEEVEELIAGVEKLTKTLF
jgi:hypothetical protein